MLLTLRQPKRRSVMSLHSLKGRVLLAAGLALGLSVAPALAALINGYDFAPAPIADRGVLKPISGNPAYGYSYLHEDGWYEVTLPSGGRTDRARDPKARTFDMYTTQGVQICSASADPQPKGQTFEQLQARAAQTLSSWEREISNILKVEERGLLELKDNGRKHVLVAAWTGLDAKGRHFTVGVIEVPRGTLMIGCGGATATQSKFLTLGAFRLAEGAL